MRSGSWARSPPTKIRRIWKRLRLSTGRPSLWVTR
jgi:hypothetical protein